MSTILTDFSTLHYVSTILTDFSTVHYVSTILMFQYSLNIAFFYVFQKTNYHIRLNHMLIVSGVFLYFGIPAEEHSRVRAVFNNAKVTPYLCIIVYNNYIICIFSKSYYSKYNCFLLQITKSVKQDVLAELSEVVSISNPNCKSLYEMMQSEGSHAQVSTNLWRITRAKSQVRLYSCCLTYCCCCRPTPPACSCGGVRQPKKLR